MRKRIFGLLGIEAGEESVVTILLSQSVFLGIFFGAFDISAHSLFLSIFDEKMMAKAYVVSGIAGIILTSVYTFLQTKMKFRNFSVVNLIFVTLFTLILWIALLFSPAKWIVFAVFIMLGPLNILAMLGFWGTAGRLFSLRQGKRLFGLVDSGLIIGIIISCYTIPVLLALNFKSHNILLIGATSVMMAAIIQIMTGAKFMRTSAGIEAETKKSKEKKSMFRVFSEDRYTRVMALFVALSVVTAFFVQYSFMAVTRQQYPAEEDMAKFLGIFTGSMMIFTLLVKLLAFSYLIRNYGLKTCLAVSPLLIAIFTAVALIIGTTMGYAAETNGFLIFFLILALSRLFSKSLKDSLESPSFKVIYQTIDEKIRYEVQSGMDGTVNEIAALSSGLLLAGLGILSFIRLIHFSLVLFIIIIAWISVAFMLYSEYRKSIRKALETVGPQVQPMMDDHDFSGNRFSSSVAFRNDYFRLISGDITPLENNRNRRYYEELIRYSGNNGDLNLLTALNKIAEDENIDNELRARSRKVIDDIQSKNEKMQSAAEKSTHAKLLLSGSRVPNTAEVLRLLRDNSIESKRFAIYIVGKFRLTEMLSDICNCAGIPSLETDAVAVLASFGAAAVPDLIRSYASAAGNINTGRTILRLLGKAHTHDADEFLYSKLWSNSRPLREIAVKCLCDSEFKPSDEQKDRLHQLISEVIGLMTWNLSARICLQKNEDKYLLEIFDRDNARWKAFLFGILSVTYDRGSISRIKENLENDTVESVNFALEMIDIVIDEAVKPKIIALLDIIPDEEKVKNLYHFYPGEIHSYKKLLEDIVNRDYNMIDIWTKACALRNLDKIEGQTMAESASALLFSPESLLQEEAARLIARSDIRLYESVSKRIPSAVREKLDKIVNGIVASEELLFEKISFLSKCFTRIPEEELMPLSGTMVYASDVKQNFSVSGGCVIWSLNGSSESRKVIIHHELSDGDANDYNPDFEKYYFLPLSSVEEFHNHYPNRSGEIMAYIDKNEA